MQINKIDTHEIIKISFIDTRNNLIGYEVFENYNGIITERKTHIPQNINLADKLSETVNFMEIAYNILFSELFNSGYEISADVKNWKVALRVIRLIIPVKLINQSLILQNDLNTIIQRELQNNALATDKFLFNSQNIAICYFNEVAAGDSAVISPYLETGEIILETIN